MLHGSDTAENAQKELDFFFRKQQTLAVIKPDAYENKGKLESLHTCIDKQIVIHFIM